MGSYDLRLSACGLDFLLGRRREAVRANRQRFAQRAVPQNLDQRIFSSHQSSLQQLFGRHLAARWKGFQLREIHHRDYSFIWVAEPAFGNSSLERHLSTFESGSCSSAGPRPLSLVSATRGLSVARSISATDAFLFLL